MTINYGRDIVDLVRGTDYRSIPDLNPVRHVLYKGAWLRVDGGRGRGAGSPWRKPERGLTRKQCLKAAIVCGAITISVGAALFLGGCSKNPDYQDRLVLAPGITHYQCENVKGDFQVFYCKGVCTGPGWDPPPVIVMKCDNCHCDNDRVTQ